MGKIGPSAEAFVPVLVTMSATSGNTGNNNYFTCVQKGCTTGTCTQKNTATNLTHLAEPVRIHTSQSKNSSIYLASNATFDK